NSGRHQWREGQQRSGSVGLTRVPHCNSSGVVMAKAVEGSTEQVVSHIRHLIERGQLRPGDRLPAERDLATRIGVSRPTVRIGLRALATMCVVRSRHGSVTYILERPPTLDSEPLSLCAALHVF